MFVSLEATKAALQSVGTAIVIVSTGFYLERRGFVNEHGKRAFGRYLQQIALPLFLFSKLVECPSEEDHCRESDLENHGTCPSVLDHVADATILLFAPFYTVFCGLIVGRVVSVICQTPQSHQNSVMLSIAFANVGSFPITLLTVLMDHVSGLDPGSIEPITYLSVYLIFAPALTWSIGFWLAHPVEEDEEQEKSEQLPILSNGSKSVSNMSYQSTAATRGTQSPEAHPSHINASSGKWSQFEDVVMASNNVLSKACQPPVIASILGVIVTSIPPIRGILANDDAPLEWLFDGLRKVGRSIVPVSMATLGMHLSYSIRSGTAADGSAARPFELFDWKTMVGTVCGKLIVMPIIGFSSFLVVKYVFAVEMSQSLSMVLLIVWTPPTASNAVVMADLAGGMREALAQALLYQYLAVAIVVSISIAFVIHLSGLEVS